MQKVRSRGINAALSRRDWPVAVPGIAEGIPVRKGGSGVAERRQRRKFRQINE